MWKRYVDDTYVVWPHGRESLNGLFNHLNSQSESIKFTMELEENNNIPFLDILISKKNNGVLSHQVYRKKTHTDQYLHANSHHHPAQKFGVINTLVTQAIRIFDVEHTEQELKHLEDMFKRNGYHEKQFNMAVLKERRAPQNRSNNNEEGGRNINLPYIKGTTEKIAKF
jgi:hypothetical protein